MDWDLGDNNDALLRDVYTEVPHHLTMVDSINICSLDTFSAAFPHPLREEKGFDAE